MIVHMKVLIFDCRTLGFYKIIIMKHKSQFERYIWDLSKSANWSMSSWECTWTESQNPKTMDGLWMASSTQKYIWESTFIWDQKYEFTREYEFTRAQGSASRKELSHGLN